MKTTVNGKEIKLVTRNDISNIVSQKVAEMLAHGFNFYFYSGSQGEEGKVCLTPDDGELFFEQKWFELDSKEERYVETMQEYFEIKKLQDKRWDVRHVTLPSKKLPECANKPALKLVKKIRGYGTTKLKDIYSVVKKSSFGGYLITFTEESGKQSICIGAKVR